MQNRRKCRISASNSHAETFLRGCFHPRDSLLDSSPQNATFRRRVLFLVFAVEFNVQDSLPYIVEIGRGRAPTYAEIQLKNPRAKRPRDSASQ